MLFRAGFRFSANRPSPVQMFNFDVEDPVELLLTRYLDKPKPPAAAVFQPGPTQKTQDFILPRRKYNEFASANPKGSVMNFEHKGLSLTFVSTNYGWQTPIASMFKLLQKDHPDLIMAQVRPDKLLTNFKLLKKSKKDDIFSDKEYWKQICRTAFETMPSHKLRTRVGNILNKSNIRVRDLLAEYKEEYDTKVKASQKFSAYHNEQYINDELLATISYYGERNQIPVGLCSLPQISERQFIVNSNTLMQLQVIFKQACEQLPMYRLQTSPRRIAQFLFPQVFLHYNDRYIATLLQYLAAAGKYKKIVVFVGLMQGESVNEYLQNRKVSTILDGLYPPKPNTSLFRQIQSYEIVEKHCLLDVLQFGQSIGRLPLENFATTNQVINFYSNLSAKDSESKKRMQVFRIKMYGKYMKLLQECEKVGESLKKKEFMRRIL